MKTPLRFLRASLPLLLLVGPAAAAKDAARDFTSLDIEQLMNVQVTGVTRRAEALASSPAAIFVLSAEDIRRSGARTIVEALRLVPGVFVARSSAQTYSVSIRGFSTSNSDKLQVMLDGRRVYSQLTSAVFWDVLDTWLDDIERIEVIRGPGGAVWGANAVNGVINIVTRPAAETQDTQLQAGAGTEEKAFAGLRSGGKLGGWGAGRAYAQAWERDESHRTEGGDAADGQRHTQAGARLDGSLGRWGTLRLSGDLYDGRQYSDTDTGPAVRQDRTDVSGRNLVAAWDYAWRGGARTHTQLYYDGYDRHIPTLFSESRDTYDLGLQHDLQPLGRHRFTVGASYRESHDETGGAPLLVIFQPQDETLHTRSAFVQDEIRLGRRGSLVLGSKLEHNDFSGNEWQPGARVGWTLASGWFTWAAVSRAVRTPNRLSHDLAIVCTPSAIATGLCTTPDSVVPVGNRNFDSERLLAYEGGLRGPLSKRLFADLALFYNDYDDLRSTEPGLRFANGLEARALGAELSLSWRWNEHLALQAWYAYLDLEVDNKRGSADTSTPPLLEGSSPQHQAALRLSTRLHPRLELDATLRYVDELPAQRVDGYAELDLRAGWRWRPRVQLALVGHNLLDDHHAEFGMPVARGEPQRGVFAEVRWSWK